MLRRRRRAGDEANFDLTPMIDCVFQLLIFFIVCTRFVPDERIFNTKLPTDEGDLKRPEVPKEQLTVYCNWDGAANTYALGVQGRNRKVIADSRAAMADLVIYPTDAVAAIREKKRRYARAHAALTDHIRHYLDLSGARVEKIEISFANDPVRGAVSGTAPWVFVSLAIDACAQVNKDRDKADQLPVNFKFANALGR
ncbi:MAG: biopolymer transporter ExbD [Planctomycetes bacterium]|nr:biopolymer transporter ExbD [Planctomycetota bacterium]